MFIKQIKHDLAFSKAAFLGMSALMIAFAFVHRLLLAVSKSGVIDQGVPFVVMALLSFVLFGVVVVSIMQIYQFYKQNFFGDAGYLMLTLPVNRGRLLASKMIVSMLWFNFMLVMGIVVMFIMADFDGLVMIIFGTSLQDMVSSTVLINLIIMHLIAAMFFCITLSHSIIAGWRIHGFIAGMVYFVYLALYAWIVLLDARFGFIAITTLISVGIAFVGTWYLLEKRMTL
ncbi:MAG: hypothetical protein FWD03_05710 [Defluviitaleaceae bacterium]|nr:hypothetical protein [Defluviitaleaceae bacterium]